MNAKKLVLGVAFAALIAVSAPTAALAGPPSAASGHAPADGRCVVQGVTNLVAAGGGGSIIAGAANGSLFGSNVVDDVILDHVFGQAKGIGAVTGASC
jgi:hypothetical protein